jgi:hypothetical protein
MDINFIYFFAAWRQFSAICENSPQFAKIREPMLPILHIGAVICATAAMKNN